jgi:hypothetical protein
LTLPSATSLTLPKTPRLAGLREWQGHKYPATGWPAIIDVDTHERLVRLFGDPARRRHVVRAPAHLLSGIATCPKCGRGCITGGTRVTAPIPTGA